MVAYNVPHYQKAEDKKLFIKYSIMTISLNKFWTFTSEKKQLFGDYLCMLENLGQCYHHSDVEMKIRLRRNLLAIHFFEFR